MRGPPHLVIYYISILYIMELDNKIFIKLLKKYTSIDEDFIKIFFKKFLIGYDLEFHISENKVSKYLNISKKTLTLSR